MKLYLFTLLVTVILAKSTENLNKKQQWLGVSATIIFLVLISGLRTDSALYSDDWNYRFAFSHLRYLSFSQLEFEITQEPGFLLYSWLVGRITADPQIYIFLSSSIIIILYVTFIYKHSINFTLTMFLFIAGGSFFTTMNIMRQCIAIGIVLHSYGFIKKRKIFPFLLMIFLAFSIHRSAIFALPMYFIMTRKNLKSNLLAAYAATFVVLLFSGTIIESMLTNSIFDNYARGFLSEGRYGVGIIRIAFFGTFEIPMLLKMDVLLEKNKNVDMEMFNSMFVSNAVLIISRVYVYVARIDYFGICNLILLPLYPQMFDTRDRDKVAFAQVSIFFLFGLYQHQHTLFHNLLFTFL